ncbi:hypothetical protein [Phormidium sp. CCY1219]|uniref:hypothetical protein n=1 Tax=Phormidium sp. CCY1219 TaxID=2886104 RepID=UPI002D1EE9ED|nr:hypothetical protein [Phormidium sp. CCY1219]MEB3828936.1 hypothetical protein [Phormidium sp. CCY1219]
MNFNPQRFLPRLPGGQDNRDRFRRSRLRWDSSPLPVALAQVIPYSQTDRLTALERTN